MSVTVDKFEPRHLLEHWFSPTMEALWFNSNAQTDAELKEKYEQAWLAAASNVYDPWQEQADGSLALIILLDQIPLNIFRGQPKSFSTADKACIVCHNAIDNRLDRDLTEKERLFLYMPLMHSENMADQDLSVRLIEATATLKKSIEFARHHRDIVKRFGRFPHRNAVLGRPSSDEEVKWLASDQAFTG